jgi:DNA-binding response OmpR family regulator
MLIRCTLRVLVAEDDERLSALLHQGLTEEGHSVYSARNGADALAVAQSSDFDVVILDVMLPRMDGLSVAKRLRNASNQTPILMLTARDTTADIIKGLDSGADDYLTKPFSFEVLLARLRAISRRGPIPQPICLEYADLRMDLATRDVSRYGRRISLTPREHSLLELLLRHKGRPVARQTILETVWGFASDVEENTVEAFVRLLRNKIDVPFEPKLIHTVRGIGYCLRLPEE